MCELECERWEDRPKVALIFEVSGAEKTGRELSVYVTRLGQRWAMADFPIPAWPFNRRARHFFLSDSHWLIRERTSFLAPLRHPGLFLWWYSAPAARRKVCAAL